MTRYLGARCKFDEHDAKEPNTASAMRTDMGDYAVNAVAKCKKECGKLLHRLSSPYLRNEELRAKISFV